MPAPKKRKRRKSKRNKREWSKVLPFLLIVFGFIITQECFILMYLCIARGYTAAAAWLTAAIALAQAIMGLGVSCYTSLCKSDHSEGGITFETAKANNFGVDRNSPPI